MSNILTVFFSRLIECCVGTMIGVEGGYSVCPGKKGGPAVGTGAGTVGETEGWYLRGSG